MIYPEKLCKGDKIAILSPATIVKEEYVEGAARFLREKGFSPVVMPSALGPASGSFAASREARLADILSALADKDVKAIFCARGGYGCVQLLPSIPFETVAANPKWLIGFSDISALHALWVKAGVASVHGPMAKHITVESDDDVSTAALLSLLTGNGSFEYTDAPWPFNRHGIGEGMLRGGNLAVLNGLASTPYDILDIREGEDVVLFIEDISEAIYAVERMLYRLWLSGALARAKGLVVGRFTEYRPDRNFSSMEQMIDDFLRRNDISGFPVAFNFPVGHVTHNLPLLEGSRVRLEVNGETTILKSI